MQKPTKGLIMLNFNTFRYHILSEKTYTFVDGLKIIEPAIKGEIQENSKLNENDKALILNTLPDLFKELSNLPISNLPISKNTRKYEQLIELKSYKIFLSKMISESHIQNDKKKIHTAIEQLISVISQSSREEQLSSKELLSEWMEEILACQKLIKPFLNSQTPLNDEGFRGVTYKIKKDNKTCGYLFGTRTMHYTITPELKEAAKLSNATVKRLLKCSVIGTKSKLPHDLKKCPSSVEAHLIGIARKQGIVNFGLDTTDNDLLLEELGHKFSTILDTYKRRDVELKLKLSTIDDTYFDTYRPGDVELIKADSPKCDKEITIKRDACMAKNMDTFLKVALLIEEKTGEEAYKSFFAFPTDHVFNYDPESIRSILSKKGWAFKLV